MIKKTKLNKNIVLKVGRKYLNNKKFNSNMIKNNNNKNKKKRLVVVKNMTTE